MCVSLCVRVLPWQVSHTHLLPKKAERVRMREGEVVVGGMVRGRGKWVVLNENRVRLRKG